MAGSCSTGLGSVIGLKTGSSLFQDLWISGRPFNSSLFALGNELIKSLIVGIPSAVHVAVHVAVHRLNLRRPSERPAEPLQREGWSCGRGLGLFWEPA